MEKLDVTLNKIRDNFEKELRQDLDNELAQIKTELPSVLASDTECEENEVKRKAILFHNPDVDIPGVVSLQGTHNDIDYWVNFLRSSKGGSWSDDELDPCGPMSKDELKQKFADLKNEKLTYLMLVFSGHGYRYNDEDFICISRKDSVSLKDIKKNMEDVVDKGLLFIDACRGEKPNAYVLSNSGFSYFETTERIDEQTTGIADVDYADKWKTEFIMKENLPEKGIVTIQSCEVKQSAVEHYYEGTEYFFGLFSRLFVEEGFNARKPLNTLDAWNNANMRMQSLDWSQCDGYVQKALYNSKLEYDAEAPCYLFSLGD